MDAVDTLFIGFAGGALAGFAVATTVFLVFKEQLKAIREQVDILMAEMLK